MKTFQVRTSDSREGWVNKVGREEAQIIAESTPEKELRWVWEGWVLRIGLIGTL